MAAGDVYPPAAMTSRPVKSLVHKLLRVSAATVVTVNIVAIVGSTIEPITLLDEANPALWLTMAAFVLHFTGVHLLDPEILTWIPALMFLAFLAQFPSIASLIAMYKDCHSLDDGVASSAAVCRNQAALYSADQAALTAEQCAELGEAMTHATKWCPVVRWPDSYTAAVVGFVLIFSINAVATLAHSVVGAIHAMRYVKEKRARTTLDDRIRHMSQRAHPELHKPWADALESLPGNPPPPPTKAAQE